jgi:hypothetical protein
VSRDNLAILRPCDKTFTVPSNADAVCQSEWMYCALWMYCPNQCGLLAQPMWTYHSNQCGCSGPINVDVPSQAMRMYYPNQCGCTTPSQCGHTVPSNAAILSQSMRLRRPNHVVVPSQAIRIYYPNQWGCTGLINVDVYPQFNGIRAACLRHR